MNREIEVKKTCRELFMDRLARGLEKQEVTEPVMQHTSMDITKHMIKNAKSTASGKFRGSTTDFNAAIRGAFGKSAFGRSIKVGNIQKAKQEEPATDHV